MSKPRNGMALNAVREVFEIIRASFVLQRPVASYFWGMVSWQTDGNLSANCAVENMDLASVIYKLLRERS